LLAQTEGAGSQLHCSKAGCKMPRPVSAGLRPRCPWLSYGSQRGVLAPAGKERDSGLDPMEIQAGG